MSDSGSIISIAESDGEPQDNGLMIEGPPSRKSMSTNQAATILFIYAISFISVIKSHPSLEAADMQMSGSVATL